MQNLNLFLIELDEVSKSKFAPEEAHLHERALGAAKSFRQAEGELMEALIAVDQAKVFLRMGYPSLFRYANEALGLSEAIAYCAITVARKAEQVPALRLAVNSGELGLSKAKKVVSVLDPKKSLDEQSSWVEKAVLLSSRKLERAVAVENPKEAISERAIYKSAKRLELVLRVSEEILLDFRRAQDRVSGAKSRSVSLEDTLQEVLRFYLERKDPEERAKRVIARKGALKEPVIKAKPENGAGNEAQEIKSNLSTRSLQFTGPVASVAARTMAASPMTARPVRMPIPAALLHQVRFRDRGSCQFHMPSGNNCGSRRWIEIHHRVPVSEGGQNTLQNLISLCSAHHGLLHRTHDQRLDA